MPTLAKVLRELKVEDALLYLDQVKIAFGEKPEIYNEFLDIMKNFKAQEIDTPGVIQQVSQLFHGYNKLILGFNTFLPDGYKIELPLEGDDATMTVITPLGISASKVGGSVVSQSCSLNETLLIEGEAFKQTRDPYTDANARHDAVGAPVEFDHAITYVTTIKKRFAHEPNTYKAFLEILHTYQKEQRSIKDVLEQVSLLFADHADLLKEFTYFLPDAVQEQAKERLTRAARESEIRHSRQVGAEDVKKSNLLESNNSTKKRSGAIERETDPTTSTLRCYLPRNLLTTTVTSHMNSPLPHSTMPLEATARERASTYDDFLTASVGLHSNTTHLMERHCFELVKEAFALAATTSAGARDGWAEFLGCVDLFSQDLVQQFELILLITELFSSRGLPPELLTDFKKLLRNHGAPQNVHKENFSTPLSNNSKGAIVQSFLWFSTPIHEIDFSRCKLGTPSYRALPVSMPHAKCGKRSSLDLSVLNDAWVSQPIGSEETHFFKHVRKNHHEEVLFKCEDERYELDMVIDSNASTISTLKSINERIHGLDTSQLSPISICPINEPLPLKKYALDLPALTILHLNVIMRIYGEHGVELIELLYKNPAAMVPIVLRRLKQKDEEWRGVLRGLVRIWREQQQQNTTQAMDHRSFHFHQREKKKNLTRHLIQEILENKNCQRQGVATDSAQQTRAGGAALSLKLGQPSIHRELFELVNDVAEQSSMSHQEKMDARFIWRSFIAPFIKTPKRVSKISVQPSGKIPCFDETLASQGEANIETAASESSDVQSTLLEELSAVELDVMPRDLYSKPCSISDQCSMDQPPQFCVCTHYLYVFFRLYHHLFERFQLAHDICSSSSRNNNIEISAIPPLTDTQNRLVSPHSTNINYNAFISIVRGLVSGSVDVTHYEDCCRRLIGNEAYAFYSLDKLIFQLLQQLKLIINDLTSRKLIALWIFHENHTKNESALSAALQKVITDETLSDNDTPITTAALPATLISLENHARHMLRCLGHASEPLYTLGYRSKGQVPKFTFEYIGNGGV